MTIDAARPSAIILDGTTAKVWQSNGLIRDGLDAIVYLATANGLEQIGAGSGRETSAESNRCEALDRDLAYVLYTSGSTGMPKGVMLTHRNAMSFVEWAVDQFAISSADRLSSHAPMHFDLSVFDLYAAACAGAAVVLVPPSTYTFPAVLAQFAHESHITVWYSVPSILASLASRAVDYLKYLSGLRLILFAGEAFAPRHLRTLMQALPAARFANLYGPTETNVCTWYEAASTPSESEPVPIGRAIANTEIILLTESGLRAAPGELGEICVRGATVMAGYRNDPSRTSTCLVPNPLTGDGTDLVYRTGDLATMRPDGNLLFKGRHDNQVKTRGYRVELEEIEQVLLAHPAVTECAVIAVPDDTMTNRLHAFVVCDRDLTAVQLSTACAEWLPRYMVPTQIFVCEDLPRTSTGKVDRLRLLSSALEQISDAT